MTSTLSPGQLASACTLRVLDVSLTTVKRHFFRSCFAGLQLMQAITRSVSRRTKPLCNAWLTSKSSSGRHPSANWGTTGNLIKILHASYLPTIAAGAGVSGQELCSTASAVNIRSFSIQPENTVYGGPTAPLPKRVTLRTIQSKYKKQVPISVVTAYDYPSAVHVRIIVVVHSSLVRHTQPASHACCPLPLPPAPLYPAPSHLGLL